MNDLRKEYRETIDMLNIPQIAYEDIISKHDRRKNKLRINSFLGIIFALLAAVLASSATVYAFNAVQRKVYQTKNGLAVSDDYVDYDKGTLTHEYKLDNDTQVEDVTTKANNSESLNCIFESWEEAIDLIPYEFNVPDIGYDVTEVGIDAGTCFIVGASYTIYDNSEISISYTYFPNSNWQFQTDYNGEIISREKYTNQYGYTFSGVTVKLDDDLYVYDIISFEMLIVQLQFKNMDIDEVHDVLEKLDFENMQ